MPLVTCPFELRNRRGDAIHGDVRFIPSDVPRPVVVMCHGFKGFKDWGPFPAWGAWLAEQGFVSVLFNFSFNGVAPENPTTFSRLDRFAENTFTRELDDLEAVLAAVEKGWLEAPSDAGRLGLMGHSRGGGTAVLQTANDARVKALVTWSAVAGLAERFTPGQVADWERQGYTEIMNARTGQVMRMNRTLYDDATAHRARLNVMAAAQQVKVPWLVIHAPDDAAVPMTAAKRLQAAGPGATLFTAAGGHTFGGRHPFDGTLPPTLRQVFDATAGFFKQHLKP